MRIDVYPLLTGELTDAAWQLYRQAFDELRTTAVARHLLTREEFDQVISDSRILKYTGVDPEEGDRLCALAVITNQLDAWPIISADYFRHRWPTHFAEGRIWYLGFFGIHPDYRASGLFEQMIEQLYRMISARHGVAALDICRRNEEQYALPQAIQGVLQALSGDARSHRIDEQSYWLYEFPAAS